MTIPKYFKIFDDDDGPLAEAPSAADWIYFEPEEMDSWTVLSFHLEGPKPDILSTTRGWLLFSEAARKVLDGFDSRAELIWLPVEVRSGESAARFWVLRFSRVHEVLHPLSFVDGMRARDVLDKAKVAGLDVFGLADGEAIAVSGTVRDAFRRARLVGGDFLELPVREQLDPTLAVGPDPG